jgi:preprotein translocase subunit SecD
MRRRQVTYVVSFVALTVVLFGLTLLARNAPVLGLDLQGGVSVVLAPKNPDEVPEGALDQSIEIIRNRVDALGVAEPEITRQGDNILVQIPGVEDQERALELVGTTAELRFRPVLRELRAEGTTLEDLGIDPNTTLPTTTSTTPPTTTADPNATTTTADPNATTTTTAAPESTTTTVPQTAEERRAELEAQIGLDIPTTSSDEDTADAIVVLPEYDRDTGEQIARYQLGPAPLKDPSNPAAGYIVGTAVDSAEAVYQNGWKVSVNLKDGDQGANQINDLAVSCRSGDPTVCPGGKLGITLDGEVQFAGIISSTATPPFGEGGELLIEGNYGQDDAKDIALALRYGSLPVELEAQSTQTVSATLGNDAKNAGIVAGIVGLVLVAIYVLLYYRLLGAVALASLLLSAGLLWVVIAYLGETRGLALTLAGITGLIVSIGVSLDSNIVYFEHMKEDIHNGRTPRSASERSFKGALSTVIKADVASLIGAGALYFLTVGAVRGFAFYLGLAMILDLAATYFFLGPAVQLIARRSAFSEHPGRYGLPSGPTKGVEPEPAGVAG